VNKETLTRLIESVEGLEDKRLARGTLWSEQLGCGCLMGTLAGAEVRESVRGCALAYKVPAFGQPWDRSPIVCANLTVAGWANSMGLTPEVIYQLQGVNDTSAENETPETRYTRVLSWLKNELRVMVECEAWDEKVAEERKAAGA
jgi:hypothetical protein